MTVIVRDAAPVESALMRRSVLESGTYTGRDRDALLAAAVEFDSAGQIRIRVAVVAGQVVGFCGVLLHARNDVAAPEIEFLIVQEHWRGHGLGVRLLVDACVLANQAGALRVRVVAHPALERFYLRAGARRIGTEAPRPHHSWYCPILELEARAEALSAV